MSSPLLLLLLVVAVSANSDNFHGSCPNNYDYYFHHPPQRSAKFVRVGFPKTQGSVWPQPQLQKSTEDFLAVLPGKFSFNIKSKTCDILDAALKRYYILTFNPPRMLKKSYTKTNLYKLKKFAGYLTSLDVDLTNACDKEWPSENMDEQYILKINTDDLPGGALLHAQSVWGILRGLETFSQLVYYTQDGLFLINSTDIRDYPRFPYRGVLLDTSRHYLPKKIILENLEIMAQNKFNVFHWHIVDDQAFPYQSRVFPTLSAAGAYDPYTHTYTLNDIVEIVYFARLRGIRVVPEFDSPGHTRSWGLGMPGLLTPCYKNMSGNMVQSGFGPINPILNSTYDFLKTFLSEVSDTFPDKYLHLGGDEVSFDCWKSNPDITKFMQSMKFGDDYSKLEQYYMQRLLDIVSSFPKNNSYLIWQEVIDNGVVVKPDTIVGVWINPFEKEIAKVTSKGYRTFLAACWYLNYITYGSDWEEYYLCDPQAFNGTDKQKSLVIGGEAHIWGEFVDSTNLISRFWPRAAAPAERLWSNAKVDNPELAAPRLEEHRCRLLIRGHNAEPVNGPGFCPVDYRVF